MILENYEINLPCYSIGDKIYEGIGRICGPYGKKILVIGGRRAMAAAKPKLEAATASAGMEIVEYMWFGKECSYETVERLGREKSFIDAHMVFAVGGGKAIDTCKILCLEHGKPLFAFPTIASNCSACTTVSIMYNEDGTFLKPHFFLHPPLHTFIDTDIIARAPFRYMWAGIGDTYAKYYEAAISSRGEKLQHFTAMGVNTSRMCMEPMEDYAEKALEDNKKGKCTRELEQVVLAIVVTTAIASIFLTRDFTPDYNSGLAHAIFYALTSYPVIEKEHLHGEVVGFGVLIALLADGQIEEFSRIHALNRRLGLPVSLRDIDITKEQFDEVMSRLPGMPDVRHYPYAVTRDMMEKAMRQLDEANGE
jgi:glycerol dehydrogenase